jgi:hypothetical protein
MVAKSRIKSVISGRRGSIRSCNENIQYINEKEKKKSNAYINLLT